MSRFFVNDIRSIHPKPSQKIDFWIDDGLLIGVDESRGRHLLSTADRSNSGRGERQEASEVVLFNTEALRNVSKVVDPETSEPMVVYHGGTVGNVFSTDYAGSGGGRESAFFFTPDLRQAKDYAGTGSVKEVFLDLKIPVETDAQLDPDEVAQAKDDGNDGYWVIEDGLVEESEIAVCSATQIKSATISFMAGRVHHFGIQY